ncbi:MAG: tRNA-dihydrouridine synthase, partial [Acidobacteriota bacterium]
ETVRRELDDAIPLTVKIRTGWDESTPNYLRIGRLAQEAGLAAVTLHGRNRKQMFTGEAVWDAVAELAAALDIPVLGNGDIRTAEQAVSWLRESGCAGVMIARGALADPWIFRQARDLLAGRPVEQPTLAMRREALLAHCDRLTAALPERAALHRMRKMSSLHLDGIEGGAELRRRLLGPSRDLPDFRAAVDQLFSELVDGRAA